MSKRYELTETAQAQLDAIGEFLLEESLEAAEKVYDELDHAFELLAENPEIGHVREDLTDRPVKFWNVFSYLVVYDPAREPLRIVAVVHGARDVERLLRNV